MIDDFLIIRENSSWKFIKDDQIIYYASSSNRFLFRKIIKVFDASNKDYIVEIIDDSFAFFPFKRKIRFITNECHTNIESTYKEMYFYIGKNKISIRYSVFREDGFYINDIKEGSFKIISEDYSNASFQINTNSIENGFYFFLLHMIDDDWAI